MFDFELLPRAEPCSLLVEWERSKGMQTNLDLQTTKLGVYFNLFQAKFYNLKEVISWYA